MINLAVVDIEFCIYWNNEEYPVYILKINKNTKIGKLYSNKGKIETKKKSKENKFNLSEAQIKLITFAPVKFTF